MQVAKWETFANWGEWRLMRAPVGWGLVVAVLLVGRYALDDFVLSHTFDPRRAETLTHMLAATFFGAGAYTAWQTQRFPVAVLVSTTASAIGSFASIVYATIVTLAPVPAWSTPADLAEALVAVPLILLAGSAVIGAIGATTSLLAVAAYRRWLWLRST